MNWGTTNKQTNNQNTRYMIFVCLCLHKEREKKRETKKGKYINYKENRILANIKCSLSVMEMFN